MPSYIQSSNILFLICILVLEMDAFVLKAYGCWQTARWLKLTGILPRIPIHIKYGET